MKALQISSILGLFLVSVFIFSSCDEDDTGMSMDPSSTLISEQEEALLRYMREEEKLARDVYNYLADLYDINVFPNIAGSEQKHVDFTLDVMSQYDVDDLGNDISGVYTDPVLQDLYADLIEKGSLSLIDALEVGATIEDLDIYDLRESSLQTDNADLINLFNLLECGSRNHMRAFVSKLAENNTTYTPQFISQDLYNEILDGNHESCN